MLEFMAGCMVGFILAVIAVALGMAAKVRGDQWKP